MRAGRRGGGVELGALPMRIGLGFQPSHGPIDDLKQRLTRLGLIAGPQPLERPFRQQLPGDLPLVGCQRVPISWKSSPPLESIV